MEQFLNFLLRGELVALLFLSLLLYFLGWLVGRNDELIVRYRSRAWYAALLVFGAFIFWRYQPTDGELIIALILRTLMTAGMVSGVVGILGPLLKVYRGLLDRAEARRQAKRAERERRRREAVDAEEREHNRKRDQELASVRQKEERALSVQKTERESREADQAHRRLRACAACDLFFNLHRVELASRFSKSDLEEFMKKYMDDAQPAEVVEMYAVQLREMMEQHLELAGTAKVPATIEQLAKWYITEKERISGLEIDEELKESHLIQLDMRYTELSQSILESITP